MAGLVTLCALAYGIRAEHLITERLRTRVPGTELALDPMIRRQEVAMRALSSVGAGLRQNTRRVNVAILTPEGTERVFGARSGRQYAGTDVRRRPYNLLEETLDHGGAVRLFFPQVDTVAFIDHWTARYIDYELFLPYQDGQLQAVGTGPRAHAEAARWMLEQRWYPQMRDYLRVVTASYPNAASLRLDYAIALLRCGDRSLAHAELRALVKDMPEDSAAATARSILAAESVSTNTEK